MFSPDGVRAVAALVTAVAWPLLAVVVLVIIAPQLRDIVSRLTDFEGFGIKAKISQKLQESAKAAETAPIGAGEPTAGEIHRALQVEFLTSKVDIGVIRRQVGELAAEYERVRASMPPSTDRTRAMEVVLAKMRTIGRAAFPLRYELSASRSPGEHLQVIASLQLLRDWDELEWLAERVRHEKPFVGYQALVALNAAAADEHAADYLSVLQQALATAEAARPSFGRDIDRPRLLDEFRRRVERVSPADAAAP